MKYLQGEVYGLQANVFFLFCVQLRIFINIFKLLQLMFSDMQNTQRWCAVLETKG